MPYFQKKHS